MSAKAILFVCAANRCRSPLATVLLQQLVAGEPERTLWAIESAGLHATPDLPATRCVQTVASEIGLDVSHHRSRSIRDVPLEKYDLILTMEQIQAEALASAHPRQADHIYSVGALVKLQIDIEDPTGRGLHEHRALRELLRRYLQAGLPRLRQMLKATGS